MLRDWCDMIAPLLDHSPTPPPPQPPLYLFPLFCVEGEEAQTDQRASMSQMINPIPLSSKRTINNLKPGKTRAFHGTTNLPFFFLRDKRWPKGISHTKKAAATKKKTVVSANKTGFWSMDHSGVSQMRRRRYIKKEDSHAPGLNLPC